MHQEVQRIREKMLSAPWPKFLRSIAIRGLRGWNGEEVLFRFPVSVIAGENGCGKSTILMAAASAYQDPHGRSSYSPSNFFLRTPWDNSTGASITYKYVEGSSERTQTFKKVQRWRFSGRPRRDVSFDTIGRVLPIEDTSGFAHIASARATEASTVDLHKDFQSHFSAIIGRKYKKVRLARADVDPERAVGVVDYQGVEYSAFHQGAGEAATLDLVSSFQGIDDTALIVVDEIEASLHPRAQRRLVHFLLWLARTKHIQVLISTHSHFVLEELPLEARIFLQRGASGISVLYGVSSTFALSRIDDVRKPELYIFVEDQESKTIVDVILRSLGIDLTPFEIMVSGGSETVLTLGKLCHQKTLPICGIGVVDADIVPKEGSLSLPGDAAPEKVVLTGILEKAIAPASSRIGVTDARLSDALHAAISLSDPHEQLADLCRRLNQPRIVVWHALATVWAEACVSKTELEAFGGAVVGALEQARANLSH